MNTKVVDHLQIDLARNQHVLTHDCAHNLDSVGWILGAFVLRSTTPGASGRPGGFPGGISNLQVAFVVFVSRLSYPSEEDEEAVANTIKEHAGSDVFPRKETARGSRTECDNNLASLNSAVLKTKMRFVVAPYAILATSVFLIGVPKESWANPLAGVSFAALKPIMENYIISLQLKGNAEEVEVRAWMHVGNPDQSGCGLYLRATGHSTNFARTWFPEPKEHRCGEYRPYMRITSPSAMYSTRVRLGNDQTYKVQVHADGWMDTYVRVLCFGFNERTIMGDPRAFCIDNNILNACKKLNNEYKDIDLETDNIRLTRTVRGIHQIVFIDVESVIESFETLAEHPDDQKTLLKICRKMILWRGVDGKDLKGCPFIRRWWASHEDDQNPYGCDR